MFGNNYCSSDYHVRVAYLQKYYKTVHVITYNTKGWIDFIKIDLLFSALSPKELTEKLELSEMLRKRTWYLQPCSAKKGEGLIEGFTWLSVNL